MKNKCSVKWCAVFIFFFVGVVVAVVGFWIYKFNFTNSDIYVNSGGRIDSKDGTYIIEGKQITLKDGYYEEETVPGAASKMIVRYFGNDVLGDFNGDGIKDSAFLLTRQDGGSGTFFYLAAFLSNGEGFGGTNAIIIGDRIAPQTIEFRNGTIILNYAERKPDEPFTAEPSLGVSRYFKVVAGEIVEVPSESASESGYLKYDNQEYNFSFSYPEVDVFNPNTGYQYVTNNSLARVDLPASAFAGTNLGEASFIVGASRDAKVVSACLKAAPEERGATSLEVINGTEMKVFSGSDPAAGNLYETTSYRAVKNGVCYEATLLLHSGNIYNYEPGAVKEFDRVKMMAGLTEILRTFKIGSRLTEGEAEKIAETSCIKGGEALSAGYYNENSKTWWFDANLNATKPGCNPACVVSEETKTAEINWRCTGLIAPASN
jgi:hypothetical protein